MMATDEAQSATPTEQEAVVTTPPLVMHGPTKLPTSPDDPGYWIRTSHLYREEMRVNPVRYIP